MFPMDHSRRGFFNTLTAATTAAAGWQAFAAQLAQAQAPGVAADSYWTVVRRQFPLKEGLIYMNAANVCPASRPVLDRHADFLRDFHSNPSFQNRDKYAEMQERLRKKLARLLRVEPGEVAITRNTSEGSNIVVTGLPLKQGDEVIITSHNHPSNNDSWKVRARREGFTIREIQTPVPAASAEQLLGEIEKAVTARTRVIAVTHLTSTCGLLYPVREIAELARRRNVWMHLDGAQTFGALDVNLGAIPCDSYSTSAHKWMMGPLEAGVLVVRTGRIKELWPSIVTAKWSDTLADSRKFEVFGQRDDPRIAALEAAADFLEMVGLGSIESRVRNQGQYLKERLHALGVEVKTNLQPALSAGVVKVNLKGRELKPVYDTLYEKHRVAIALTASGDAMGLRFSPHIYNTKAEADEVVSSLKKILA